MTKTKIDLNIASNSFTGYFSGLWNFLCVKRQYKIIGLYVILAIAVLFLIDVFGNFLNDYFGDEFYIVDNDFITPANASDGWYNSTDEFHEGHYHKKIFSRPNSFGRGLVGLVILGTLAMACSLICLLCKNCWEDDFQKKQNFYFIVFTGVFLIFLRLLGKFVLENNIMEKTYIQDNEFRTPFNVSDGWFIEKNIGLHYKHYHKVVTKGEFESGICAFIIGIMVIIISFVIITIASVCIQAIQFYWIKPIQEYNETYYSLRNLDNIDATV